MTSDVHKSPRAAAPPMKLAANEQFNRDMAFELGFWKAACDAGLSKQEYEAFRQFAIQILQRAQRP